MLLVMYDECIDAALQQVEVLSLGRFLRYQEMFDDQVC